MAAASETVSETDPQNGLEENLSSEGKNDGVGSSSNGISVHVDSSESSGGGGGGGGGVGGGVPVSLIVRAVHTLSSPPFTPWKAGAGRGGGRGAGSACSPRLQLAAVSVLRVLVSGEGAGYVSKMTAAAAAEGVGASAGVAGGGEAGRRGEEAGGEQGEKDAEGSGDGGGAGESHARLYLVWLVFSSRLWLG